MTVVIIKAKSNRKDRKYPLNIGKQKPKIIKIKWISVILNLFESLKNPKNLLLP